MVDPTTKTRCTHAISMGSDSLVERWAEALDGPCRPWGGSTIFRKRVAGIGAQVRTLGAFFAVMALNDEGAEDADDVRTEIYSKLNTHRLVGLVMGQHNRGASGIQPETLPATSPAHRNSSYLEHMSTRRPCKGEGVGVDVGVYG